MSSTPPDRAMSTDELVQWIERESAARRGASAAELVASYRNGTLHEPSEVYDILGMAFLLPVDHPLHAQLDGPAR